MFVAESHGEWPDEDSDWGGFCLNSHNKPSLYTTSIALETATSETMKTAADSRFVQTAALLTLSRDRVPQVLPKKSEQEKNQSTFWVC